MSVPQTKQAVQKAAPPNVAQCVLSETWKAEIQKVLPKELLIEAFLRVTRTIASEKKFAECDPKSFLAALLKCARAGLVPDGLHAHLIPFGNQVTCIFDWKGVVDLASRNGIEVVPKVVCEYDSFSVEEDDGSGKTVVHHSWGLANRGTIVTYYSRARHSSGRVDYEFMTRDQVEETRQNYSTAKNSKAWEKSFDEQAKKTVIKRHSKRWPISQEARAVLSADDDAIEVEPLTISKPLFGKTEERRISDKKPEPESSQPEPEGQPTQPEPNEPRFDESEQPERQPQPTVQNPLKGLRSLAKMSGIKEGVLLDFWTATGATDGSPSSLEEVSMASPALIQSAVDNWPQLAESIKEARGGAS